MTRDELDGLAARLRARPREVLRPDTPPVVGYRESAVLVPLLVDDGAPTRLLYTVRRADLPTHAGQIAFPGGKRDESDADAIATAVREAEEELAIPRAQVEVLGLLDDCPTPTGFVITPVVAAVRGPLELVPAAGEVAAAFAASLEELRHPSRYTAEGERSFLGVRYVMHTYRWEEHRIWGATARITHQLLALLAP